MALMDQVKNLSATQKRTLWVMIQEATDEGWTMEKLQREVGKVVGLNDRQSVAVSNYRKSLKAAGVPEGKRQRMVDSYINRLHKQRARTIARTELARQTQNEILLSANPNQRKRWITHRDEKTCPQCGPLHRRVFDLDNVFPGGMLTPPLHPNCRCRIEIAR